MVLVDNILSFIILSTQAVHKTFHNLLWITGYWSKSLRWWTWHKNPTGKTLINSQHQTSTRPNQPMKSQKSECVPIAIANAKFKLTFIYDYPMHCLYIEQLGSKGEVGMWRHPCQILLLRLGPAVVGLNNSSPQTAFRYGGRPHVPWSGPNIQSINISQARNCWKNPCSQDFWLFGSIPAMSR